MKPIETIPPYPADAIGDGTPVTVAMPRGGKINATFKRLCGESAKHGLLAQVKSEHNGGLYTVRLADVVVKKTRVNAPKRAKTVPAAGPRLLD